MTTDVDEWFDVVDEHDQVIDRQRRGDVHRRRLRHRAVHIFVRRADGRLLIHKRTESKEEFPGVWTSSACGHVSSGEDYSTAAGRELTEELGITVKLERCHKFDACPATCMEFTELFECRWEGEVIPDPTEIQTIEWIETEELSRQIDSSAARFSPAFLLLFSWYKQRRR